MNGTESLIETLRRLQIDTIFGYPGGAIMPVYDALVGQLRHVLCRHEQGAAFAAQGYSRSSGRPGVCLATSGPGATNLVTGIADAHMDSVPLLVITGQVETGLIGSNAFQEVDIVDMTRGIVKRNYQVTDANDIAATVMEAYRICSSGRPGPVLIDLPKDIQQSEVEPTRKQWQRVDKTPTASPDQLHAAGALISKSRRPIIIAGGGVKIAGAGALLIRLSERLKIPVATTLNGIGLMPKRHPYNLGMLGMHGTDVANDTIQHSDLVIAIGARFDDRATGKVSGFAPHAKIIHVDVDERELNKNITADVAICADATAFLTNMIAMAERHVCGEEKYQGCARRVSPAATAMPRENINAPALLESLDNYLNEQTFVTVDVGQHQMWTAQHVSFTSADQFLTSGGLGTMGFGLPAAIGVQIAHPGATVVNITGDGSFMMNVQELATVRRYKLPIKILLMNNQHLGLVRQQQELFYGERYSAVDLSDNPDFAELGSVFGFESMVADTHCDAEAALHWLMAARGPALLELRIPVTENVWPFVVPGESNDVRLSAPDA